MKKILAIFLLLIISVSVLNVPSQAVNPLIFTAINDVLQLGPSPSNVPIRSDGTVYVLPETFTRLLGLSSFYNSGTNQLLVYNSEEHLMFDMSAGTAEDESGVSYSKACIRKSGRNYVAAKMVCDKFGYYYSYVTVSPLGPVVRINSSRTSIDDYMFIEKNAETMKNMYLSYMKTYMNETELPTESTESTTESESVDAEQPETDTRNVYLAVKCTDPSQVDDVLDVLETRAQKTVFFVDENVAADGDALRKICAEGHSVGILFKEGSTAEDIDAINRMIKAGTLKKTNLVFFEKASYENKNAEELESRGYKTYSPTYAPTGKAQTIIANVKTHIEKRATSRILFSADAESVTALDNLIYYMRQHNCIIYSVTIFD